MSKILILFITFLSFQTFGSDELNDKKFLFKYEGDQHYEVTFTKDKVHWECVQGDEIGRLETDLYQSGKISEKVYFIQWIETDGTFVVLTINLETMRIISTGISGTFKWFRSGTIENITF